MSSSTNSVDYTRIRRHIRVPRYDNNLHNRRDAAHFIDLGYRVTDDYGRDVTVETRPDGTRRLVVGEDRLAAYNETIAQAAEAGARNPPNRSPRIPTDYEAGRPHPKDCGILNCDHPVHFGGDEYGNLVWSPPEKKPSDTDKKSGDGKGGAGGSGAAAGGVTGGAQAEKA